MANKMAQKAPTLRSFLCHRSAHFVVGAVGTYTNVGSYLVDPTLNIYLACLSHRQDSFGKLYVGY